MTSRIHAVKVADIFGIPDSVGLYGLGHCASLSDLAVYTYVVERHGQGPLLFDTGCAPPDRAATHGHPPVEPDGYQSAAQAVAAYGVDPSSITTVVLSHLHWDHCYGLTAFPEAQILVQRRELQGAFAPYPEYRAIYESFESGHQPHWMGSLDRIRPVEGWRDLGDGISLVPLPGHTDGSQGMVVETAPDARWCCVGDLLPGYENWTGLRPGDGRPTGVIPNGLHSDLAAWRASVETVARHGWTPLPAHDNRVESVLGGEWRPAYCDPGSLPQGPATALRGAAAAATPEP
jgi:glyoxylase-like metal-dependent hydrolase (beta-lactamase superfamily II)